MSNWTMRKRSCSTVWTHPDIPWQIILMHNTGKLEFRQVEFETVEEAMEWAQEFYNVS